MRYLTLSALSLALIAGTASAQGMDVSALASIDDANVMGPDGEKVGEIEEILVDASGLPVAAVVEVGGFLDIGDEDIVIALDDLTFQDGNYATQMTEDELEALPKWER